MMGRLRTRLFHTGLMIWIRVIQWISHIFLRSETPAKPITLCIGTSKVLPNSSFRTLLIRDANQRAKCPPDTREFEANTREYSILEDFDYKQKGYKNHNENPE